MSNALSVVIAAKDAEATIADQVRALVGQPWPNSGEIIIADNGSTDATVAIVQSFRGGDIPVRVIDASQTAGAAYARNTGVGAATFGKIAFCDADDVVDSRWVAEISSGLDDAPAIGGRLDFERLNPRWAVGSRGRLLASERLPMFDGVFPVLSSCNLGITRRVFEELGGFDVGFLRAQDAELSLRLHQAGIAAQFAPNAVVHYRMRSTVADIYTQAHRWGQAQVALRQAMERPLTSTTRSWIWLVSRLPIVVSRTGRARWAYVAGTRVGTAQARRHGAGRTQTQRLARP